MTGSKNLKIGDYNFIYDANRRDLLAIDGGEAYIGSDGNDFFMTNTIPKTKVSLGALWYIPSIMVGGKGDDNYHVGPGMQAIIGDTYSGDSNDTLKIWSYASNLYNFFSIENRHIYYQDTLGTFVLGIDFLNNRGELSKIEFLDISTDGNSESINAFLSLYKTKEDQSWQNIIDDGLFNPYVMGVEGAIGVRSAIDGINAYKNMNGYSFSVGQEYTLHGLRDYDGYLHADVLSNNVDSYKYQGFLDVNNDGEFEAIFTNKDSGRWATVSLESDGNINFDQSTSQGVTRVVGIYIDPLVTSGDVVKGSDFDSQRRFQNDLEIDNLAAKTSGDYDGDGLMEVYWKTNDGTAYLRALMHADGNIQYANYQSEEQMSEYLTAQGHESIIAEIV